MAESVDLAKIRNKALLRALRRAVENPSVTVVTVASLAEELSLHPAQLNFVMQPLISGGLITVKGELDSGAVAFTERGMAYASDVIDRASLRVRRTRVLCIDTEPAIVQRMKEAHYVVFDVSMGFRTGKRAFSFPAPNEVDLIVCDLRRPACFDSTDWGPGRSNDNFRCKIIPYEKVGNSFYVRNDRRHALHKLIYETQMGKQVPGTFGPKEVNRAVVEGGVPFLLFLNEEWVSRMEEFPNWLDVGWSFLPTAATRVELAEPLLSLLPEVGNEVRLKLAIQHRIEKGPLFRRMPPPLPVSTTPVASNNIGDVFGQFVRMGKGSVWLLPATHQNADVLELFALRLEMARQLLQPRQESGSATKVPPGDPAKQILYEASMTEEEAMPVTKIEVFISHSSVDVEIARKLINLLRSAIQGLQPEVIRCTSVPGYRLEGGAKTDEQLLKESLGAEVFIALLSQQSLRSTYVLFELGARWGADKHLLPLVVAGMSASELKPPLNGRNAHSAAIEDHVFQLVDEVASKLGLSLAKPSVYGEQVKELVRVSEEAAAQRDADSFETAAAEPPRLSSSESRGRNPDSPRQNVLADLISELEDNLECARAPRVGDAYARPSSQVWKSTRNRLTLPNHLRSELTHIYRQIDSWCTVVESGVSPNMGSPAIDGTIASLRNQLWNLIEELKKLL
jgi:hypothetical protein